MTTEKRKAYLALAWVSFFWGTTYVAAKISAHQMPGLFVAGVRQAVAGAAMVTYFKSRGYKWPDKTSLLQIIVQAVLLLGIGQGLLTWALESVDSGLAAIIAALMPLFVAVFSIWLLRFAKFTPLLFGGLLLGFAGIAVIFYEHLSQLLNAKYALGIGFCLTATVAWSLGTVLAARYKPDTDILFSAGLQMLISGVMVLTVCGISGKWANPLHTTSGALWSLLYLIVVGSLLSYSAYGYVVSKLPPTQVSVYAYINPLVAVVLGWLILHEAMSVNVITGTLITLGGVWLVNKEFKKQKAPKAEKQPALQTEEAA